MAADGDVTPGQDVAPPVFDSYARLSWNPNTRELEKLGTQHGDNGVTITRQGGVCGERLDDGLSAWKPNVRRPGFEELLRRAGAGESQGIAVWHVDRLFRQPRDLEKLIALADKGFRVISSHGSRDLSDPDDRFILRIEVAHAARSSDDTSRRIKRRQAVYREEGRRTGGRPGFGFPRIDRAWSPGPGQSEQDRPVVTVDLVEREQKALQDAAADLLSGLASQRKIADRWNTAGLLSAEGRTWTPSAVRDTLARRPILAGRVEHEGVLASRLPGSPIIEERVWLRLRAQFAARRRGAPVKGKYLGVGIIRCAVCGMTLQARDVKRNTAYRCNKQRRGCGSVHASMRGVDFELRALTVARLSDSRYAQAIRTARARVSTRLKEVKKEIDDIKKLKAQLSERVGRREMEFEDWATSNHFLMQDLAPLLEEQEALSGGSPDGPTEAVGAEEIAREWDEATSVAERRALLMSALGTDHVRVFPANGKLCRTFDGTRVRLVDPAEPLLNTQKTPV